MAHLYGLARLGRDAELRVLNNGDTVADLSLAFTYGRKGDDGKRPTQWVSGSLWGKRAESLAPYLLKGGLVMVTLEDVNVQEFVKKDGTASAKLVGRVLDLQLAGGDEKKE
jgi:single-strand DNA-binding protein